MATVVQVASRKYKRAGVIYEIPYFAEDSTGYPDCTSLVSLDVPHKVCRARVVGGTLTRMYAGLVPVSDPRASARRRYVADIGELAYMKGTYGVYTRTRSDSMRLCDGNPDTTPDVIKYSKRLSGAEAYNLFVSIRSSGGRGGLWRWIKPSGKSGYWSKIETFDFDADIGKKETHEWSFLLDSGNYRTSWATEFLGTTDWSYIEYPSDTPA